jgi:ribosomal-protein-alanine N-acetyltransferase
VSHRQGIEASRSPTRQTSRELATERLLLRRWREQDREPFAALNADPEVMEFFPAPLTRAESDALIDRIERHFDEHGFAMWAVEVTAESRFIGFVGLGIPSFTAAFTPCVEIGWRLARAGWGQGYAVEGALAAARFGFDLGLSEIVAFTAQGNHRSRRVMEKLAMQRDLEGDFDHPSIAAGHPLQRHVLYRLRRSDLRC